MQNTEHIFIIYIYIYIAKPKKASVCNVLEHNKCVGHTHTHTHHFHHCIVT